MNQLAIIESVTLEHEVKFFYVEKDGLPVDNSYVMVDDLSYDDAYLKVAGYYNRMKAGLYPVYKVIKSEEI